MIMNILEQENLIKGAPDDVLIQEAQAPSGNLPQFLIVSELQRRKQMRDRVVAQQEQPEQTVSEQIVAQSAPQGIAGLASEMPSQAPSMPMPQQTIPQEMMAATEAPIDPQMLMAAGGGRMPYRRMAGGGMVPPNSLVEDAAKFNPQTMYDMDASQMAMASPTNMGIASVLPMAAGGVVKMGLGGYLTGKEGFIPDRYQDEGKGIGSLDYSQIGSDALTAAEVAAVAMMLAPEPTSTAAGAILKGGTTLAKQVPKGLKFAKTIPSKVKDFLGREDIAKHQLGKRLAAILGVSAAEAARRIGDNSGVGDVIKSVEASERENNQPTTLTTDQAKNFFLNKNQGGIVKMQAGGTTPFVGMDDVRGILKEEFIKPPAWLDDVEGDFLSQDQAERLRQYMREPQEIDTTFFPKRKSTFEEVVTDLENKAPEIADEFIPKDVDVSEYDKIRESIGPNLEREAERKTARELLMSELGKEVEPYDPTELLLKSQERADQRAMSQALINFGAGIASGDIAGGAKDAGTAIASIKDKQDALEQELEIRRGEAQSQAQKDKIARNIMIADKQLSMLDNDEDRENALTQRQISLEDSVQRAIESGNANQIRLATFRLAENNAAQDRYQFNQTLNQLYDTQEQTTYREELRTIRALYQKSHEEILDKVKNGKIVGGESVPYTQEEINAMMNTAFSNIKNMLTNQKTGGSGAVGSEIQIIGKRSN